MPLRRVLACRNLSYNLSYNSCRITAVQVHPRDYLPWL